MLRRCSGAKSGRRCGCLRWGERVSGLILGDAARVAAVSDNAARHLLAAGAPPDRLRVVPNGVETERFAGATPRELPFDRESFVIGFIGLFYPWHGVRHLAEAFPLILEACPNARLLLVGDGEDAAVVRRLLEGSGAIDRVLLPGLVPADDVPGYLLACDVLASPHAASEGFIGSPIKIWEYMASGRAIIASALAQLGDVLEDERTALPRPAGGPRGAGRSDHPPPRRSRATRPAGTKRPRRGDGKALLGRTSTRRPGVAHDPFCAWF